MQSELVANEAGCRRRPDADPRAAAVAGGAAGRRGALPATTCACVLVHRDRHSGLRMAAAMDHVVDGPEGIARASRERSRTSARVSVATRLEPGETLAVRQVPRLRLVEPRSLAALRDQVARPRWPQAAHGLGRAVPRTSATYLDDFWARADVEIDGDAELQQAVRFALFHVLQAGARAEQRAIPAKGLTGPGYDGHAFWDTETFVLPVLTYTAPAGGARRAALAPRHARPRRGAGARARLARAPRSRGARSAARSARRYWPAGHRGVPRQRRHRRRRASATCEATGDEEFERDVGARAARRDARLWRSLGHHDAAGRFRIDGVTGPDEYSAIADNNVYTNLMAAAEPARRGGPRARDPASAPPSSASTTEEIAAWRDAADAMVVPYDERARRRTRRASGFTDHAPWDFASTPAEQYPLLLHFPYFDLYRKQVVKQADLVLALFARGDRFTPSRRRATSPTTRR